jgi:hypothetical protein
VILLGNNCPYNASLLCHFVACGSAVAICMHFEALVGLLLCNGCSGHSHPNGALRTNKVLMYTGSILVLTNKLFIRKAILNVYKMVGRECTLALVYRLFKRIQKGGRGWSESRGVCNLIYRSLFYYYGDYSTSIPSICFPRILP